MSGCWDQLLWIGDVVADKDYTFYITGVTSGAVTITEEPVVVTKGSWFANPLVFWAWVVDQVGDIWHTSTVSFPNPGEMVFTPAPSAEWFATPSSGSMIEELSAFSRAPGAPSTSVAVFAPSYPAMVLDIGVMFHHGHSHRAHTGKAFTMPAIEQRTRDVQVQFDYLELAEYEQWRNLWDWRFARGRSCTLFHGTLPTQIGLYLEDLGALDQLTAEPSLATWKGERTVEYRNAIAHDEGPISYRRRPNIPLSEGPGVQTWYIPPARSF